MNPKKEKIDAYIILSGLPGDMATKIKDRIIDLPNFDLVQRFFQGLVPHDGTHPEYEKRFALTGNQIKGKSIDSRFIENYENQHDIKLVSPVDHQSIISLASTNYSGKIIGINFATAEGYNVNHLFAYYNIPFISGVTGVNKEQENDLEMRIKDSNICAVIDKNMSVPLVLISEMLKHISGEFSNSLTGFSGYGIDSHQKTKKDNVSGTLTKWSEYLDALGISFYCADGDRTAEYGHGDHFIRIASPEGDVKITLQTEVLGRTTYIDGVINHALPFLLNKMISGKKGQIYSMGDVLRG
ncbi:MAG: hypothetical protein ACOYT4_02060 [Nanoarchaeota archaeon]